MRSFIRLSMLCLMLVLLLVSVIALFYVRESWLYSRQVMATLVIFSATIVFLTGYLHSSRWLRWYTVVVLALAAIHYLLIYLIIDTTVIFVALAVSLLGFLFALSVLRRR
ncbi:MAG: hypothetical protein V1735_03895 [Nanoarchaeota archaeon]